MMPYKKVKKDVDQFVDSSFPTLPKFGSADMIAKVARDNEIKYSYDFEILFWDIEAVDQYNAFAHHQNQTSYITMI